MPSTGYLYYKSIKCSNWKAQMRTKQKTPTTCQSQVSLLGSSLTSSLGWILQSPHMRSSPFGSGRHQGTHCAHCPRLCLGDQPPPGPLGSGLPPRAVSSLQSNWPLSRPAHHNEPFSLCLCVSSLLLSRTTNYAPPITLKIPGGLCVHTPSGTVLCRLFLERCGSAPQPL